jgi:hypothetical protein
VELIRANVSHSRRGEGILSSPQWPVVAMLRPDVDALSGHDIWRFTASVWFFCFVLFSGIRALRLHQQLSRYGFHQFLFGSSLMRCKRDGWSL